MLGLYSTILIPFVISIIYFIFFKKEITWWEYCLNYTATILIAFISFQIYQWTGTAYTEYYGSIVTKIRDYQKWNEWIEKTCERKYACGTNKDGSTKYCTETYDCSYEEFHPQYYQAYTDIGESFRLNSNEYKHCLKSFGRRRAFVDMQRDYYTIDGDMYETKFEKSKDDEYIPATTTHLYENRIKASNLTIFNLKKITKEQFIKYKLYDYPKYNSEIFFPSITGMTLPLADKELNEINGRFGSSLQVRCFFWIYKDCSATSGLYQEYYFTKGNKNEVHICIGIDNNNNITWVHPFTWSKTLNTAIIKQDIIALGSLTDIKLANYIKGKFINQLKKEYTRREFSKFDYIQIQIKWWEILITWIISLIANLFLMAFSIENEYYSNYD